MKRRARLSDERGQLLILTGVIMLSLLTMTAFSFNAGYMYDKRNRLYAAADAGAMTGAIEVKRNGSISSGDLLTFVKQQVTAHGFDPDAAGFSITVNHPPASGPYTGAAAFVEVILSEQTATFMSGVLDRASLLPGARAVAGSGANPNCIVIFDHATFTNPATGSEIHSTDCSITINGQNVPTSAPNDLYNRANITARTIGVVHTGTTGCWSGGDCTNVKYGVARGTDPLWDLPDLGTPASRGLPAPTCTGQYMITASETITTSDVDKYACGFDLKGSGGGTILTFQPGLYWIDGPVTDSGGSTAGLSGNGVLLYFTGRLVTGPSTYAAVAFSSSNNIEVNISGPTAATSATYEGILFYQSRNTPQNTPVVLGSNNTNLDINGAMYFPTTKLVMANGNLPDVTNDCTVVVAWAIEVDKPHMFLNNTCVDFGTSPVLSLSLAE